MCRFLSIRAAILMIAAIVLLGGCDNGMMYHSVVYTPRVAQLAWSVPSNDFSAQTLNEPVNREIQILNKGSLAAQSVVADALPAPFSWKGGTYPGIGGTCGPVIASSCTVVVTYTPTNTVTSTAEAVIHYDSGAGNATIRIGLSGTGIYNADLQLSSDGLTYAEGQSYSFGTVVHGAAVEKKFFVKYFGGLPATGVSVSIVPSAGPFSLIPSLSTCGTNVTGDCQIGVRFSGLSSGSASAKLKLVYDNGGATVERALPLSASATQTAVANELSVIPQSGLDFGSVPAGSTSDLAFTVTSVAEATVPATITQASTGSSAFVFKGGSFPGTGGSCALGSPLLGSCTFVVSFAPSSTGPATGSLELQYTSGTANGQTPLLTLTGTGTQAVNGSGGGTPAPSGTPTVVPVVPATLALTPSGNPVTWPSPVLVGSSADQVLTVSNTSGGPATQIRVANVQAPFSILTDGCSGQTLASSQSCQMTVRFTPTSGGTAQSLFSVSYFDGNTTQALSTGLSAQGNVGGASLGTAPYYMMILLAPVGGTGSYTGLTLNNYGNGSATILSVAIDSPFYLQSNACAPGTVLAPAKNCAFTVAGTLPSNQQYRGNLTFTYIDGNGNTNTYVFPLYLYPVSPARIAVSPSTNPAVFPTPYVGQTSQLDFTVTSTGDNPNNVTFSTLQAPFQLINNTCNGWVSEDGPMNCHFSVIYAPTTEDPVSTSLQISYFDGLATQTYSLGLTGQGNPAVESKFDTPTVDFYDVVVGASKTLMAQVDYIGGSDTATIESISVAAPFTAPAGGSCGGIGGKFSSNCTFGVTFSPTAEQQYLVPLTLTYDDGTGSTQTITMNIAGQGIAPALLSLGSTPSLNFGTVPVNGFASNTYTLSNSGAYQATISSLTVGQGSGFSLISNTCGTTVPAGGNCTFTVGFTPAAPGPFSAPLTVAYNDGANDQTLSGTFQGTGDPGGNIQASPATLAFGRLIDGNTKILNVTLNYSGLLPVTITSADLPTGYSLPGTGSCSSQITSTCSLAVELAPTAAQTSYVGAITLHYTNGEGGTETLAVGVSGTGQTPAALALTPNSSTLDAQTVSAGGKNSVSLTFTNTGATDATAFTIPSLTAPFSWSSNTCQGTLPAFGSCQVTAQFAPTAAGKVTETPVLTYFDGVTTQSLPLTVTGTGDGSANLSFSVATLDAGHVVVNGSGTVSVTLNYLGVETATLSTPAFTGPFSVTGFSGGGTCTTSVSASCTFVITFSPSTSGGATGSLSLSYNDGSGNTKSATLSLTGTGDAPARLSLTDGASYSFGETQVGSVATHAFTVSYSGTAAASGLSLSGLAAPFSFAGGSYPGTGGTCGTTLSSGNCTIVLAFAPTSPGSQGPQTVSLSYFDGATSQSVSLALSGLGYTQASLSLSITGSGSFNAKVGGTSTQTVTVTSNGPGTAADIQIHFAGSGTPFSIGSGNCGTTLAAGNSCTFPIAYSPTSPGVSTATLDVDYASGTGTVTATLSLSGGAGLPVTVALGDNHTCAITRLGQVKCWGANDKGQLGLGLPTTENVGDTPGSVTPQLQTVSLGTNRYAKALALGDSHTCALLDNGSVKCWGWNAYGQLGLGSTVDHLGDDPSEMGDNLPAVDLGTGKTAVAITAGYSHTCAILSDGTMKCWGLNATGQLGLGDTVNRGTASSQMGDNLPAVSVGTGLTVLTAAASPGHTCALLSNHTVKCWGYNFWGQLGLPNPGTNQGSAAGQMGDNLPAISLGTGRTATGISVGGGFTCVTLDDGGVKCFGRNDSSGNLGTTWCEDDFGNVGSCASPQYPNALSGYGAEANEMGNALSEVSLGSTAVANVSLGNTHACALLTNGNVKCWGLNDSGQLGLGDVDNRGADPTQMGSALPYVSLGTGHTATSLVLGNDHSCAVLDDQSVKCWGSNDHGELGLGDTIDRGTSPDQMGDSLPAVPFE